MAERDDYRITSVVFGERWLEISFYETRDETTDVIDVKQRLIRPTLFKDEIDGVLEGLADLLDRAAIHRRNPVTTFQRTVE